MNQQSRITPETISGLSLILGAMTGFLLGLRVDQMLVTLNQGPSYAETAIGLVVSGIAFVVSVFLWRKRRDMKKTLAWDIGLAFVASALFCGAIQLTMLSLLNLLTFRPDSGLSLL